MLTNDKPVYGYYCLMRPPMPGAVPRDGMVRCEAKEGTALSGHHYWGRVMYERKLTDYEVKHYDLEPAAMVAPD